MIRYIRYGIRLGIADVTIDPFGPKSFSYHVGNVAVDYSSTAVTLTLPGSGSRQYTITGLLASTSYNVGVEGSDCGPTTLPPATTDASGTAVFDAPVGLACTVSLTQK
jgi:hypothetical protein